MNHFCIIANHDKDEGHRTARYILSFLEKNGKKCVIAHDRRGRKNCPGISYTDIDEIPEETECIIVLGGDGTFIQAAIDVSHRGIPLLGVNMGTLGFLTEIEKQNLVPTLERLMRDECYIEERLMLSGRSLPEAGNPLAFSGEELALNDVVVTKSGACRMITALLAINGELVETYIGDGVIISTPTGSTGYNLSAGGPVMTPGLEAVIITPICPHSLNKRSLVVSAKDVITITIGQGKAYQKDAAEVIFDGRAIGTMQTGDCIRIVRSGEKTRIVKLKESSFFGILRNKLKVSE